MDFCNVNVRVVYDFEYRTKYGRNIKIKTGERLLLIKKTNDDWWQVIRSTDQRPFFVPATYVEEIKPGPPVAARRNREREDGPPVAARRRHDGPTSSPEADTQNQSSYHSSDHPGMTVNFHTSIKNQQGLDTKCYSILPTQKHAIVSSLKKEIYSSKSKLVSATMTSSGYNSLGEEIPVFDEEELVNTVNDTNIQEKNDTPQVNDSCAVLSTVPDNKQDDATAVDSVSVLSGPRDNSKSSITPSCDTFVSNFPNSVTDSKEYYKLANSNANTLEVGNNTLVSCLPASNSLENLSLQIELKTSSLRNASDGPKQLNYVSLNKYNVYSNLEDIVCQNKNNQIDRCNIFCTEESKKVKKEKFVDNSGKLSKDLCGSIAPSLYNNNLQYHGSFKSDTEIQRWSKKTSNEKRTRNFYSCSEESSLDLESTSLPHDQLHYVGSQDIKTSQTPSSIIVCKKEIKSASKTDEVLQQTEWKDKIQKKQFGSDSQLSHLKSNKEKTISRHSLDSVIEGHVTGSSSKDFEKRKYSFESSKSLAGSHQTNSDKSSIDSLLDIDNDGDFRKVYGGTTSDSLVPTDGEDLVSSDSSETDSIKIAKSKQGELKSTGNIKKVPLTRRRRVISSRSRPDILQEPPSPVLNQVPLRCLGDGWNEYDTSDGRKYFYNLQTKEKKWKPPRRNYNTNMETADEEEPDGTDDMFVVNLALPSGWKSEIDNVSGHSCYIHVATGAKWFSSTDSEGRVYFFGENSTTSSWTLPENVSENAEIREANDLEEVQPAPSLRASAKSQSMILSTSLEDAPSITNISHNWPQLWDGTMCVLKEGPLNKTKITENGKRVRKNWASSHAVLTELLLLFFKDNKGFPSMMSGHGRPELSVDLNGTMIDCGEKVSSRKHVYLLSTMLGLQVLIQCDSSSAAEQWEAAITAAIYNLPSSASIKGARNKAESPVEDSKLNARIGRSKSMKLKNKCASIEDISVNNAERQTKIKERLKKFFHRRPTVELLVKKGIWKDEPVFGCQLEHVCPAEPPRVPLFVQQCIHYIEQSEDNMKTDGLYRASGNLSQVQKIRLKVDQNIYSLLEDEEDVHVLAGTLKLFFRELKQPVIPFNSFHKAIHASINPNRTEKIREFRELVKSLPPCNHDTLKYILQHLLRVSKYQEHNRMHIPNIAIVFGPTLMWPQQQSLDMAVDLMQQNMVIECLLSDFQTIFT